MDAMWRSRVVANKKKRCSTTRQWKPWSVPNKNNISCIGMAHFVLAFGVFLRNIVFNHLLLVLAESNAFFTFFFFGFGWDVLAVWERDFGCIKKTERSTFPRTFKTFKGFTFLRSSSSFVFCKDFITQHHLRGRRKKKDSSREKNRISE